MKLLYLILVPGGAPCKVYYDGVHQGDPSGSITNQLPTGGTLYTGVNVHSNAIGKSGHHEKSLLRLFYC